MKSPLITSVAVKVLSAVVIDRLRLQFIDCINHISEQLTTSLVRTGEERASASAQQEEEEQPASTNPLVVGAAAGLIVALLLHKTDNHE